MAETVEVRCSVTWTNERAIRAIRIIGHVLSDVGDDFGYRDDVQKAIRAARYLAKHVAVHADCGDCAELNSD